MSVKGFTEGAHFSNLPKVVFSAALVFLWPPLQVCSSSSQQVHLASRFHIALGFLQEQGGLHRARPKGSNVK